MADEKTIAEMYPHPLYPRDAKDMTAEQQIRAKALKLAVLQSAGTGFGPMETAKEFERYIRDGK